MNKNKEVLAEKWQQSAFAVSESKELEEQQSIGKPFFNFFIYLTLIVVILYGIYDVILLGYQSSVSAFVHYVPGILAYIFLIVYLYSKRTEYKDIMHFFASLILILPIIHLAITSPPNISSNYFFIAIILTMLYYMVPGKSVITALMLAIILSFTLFMVIFVLHGSLNGPEILNLLFFILINLAGLMITYMLRSLLMKIESISKNLEEKSERLDQVKEEFIETLSGLELGVLLLDSENNVIASNESFSILSSLPDIESGDNLTGDVNLKTSSINEYYWRKIEAHKTLGEELNIELNKQDSWLYLKGLVLSGDYLENMYLLIIEDITESKRNKFAHDQNERHLRTVLNQSSNIVLYEKQESELFFSENVLKLTGYTSEELCRRQPSYENLVYEEDRSILRRKYRSWFDEGRLGVLYLWYRISRRSGETIWIEERMSVLHSENGDEIITGILIDNSDLKKTEQELKESEQNLSRAQEIAHLGSWRLKLSSDEFRMSEEMYRMMKLDKGSESNWRNFLDFVHRDDQEEAKRRLSIVMDKKSTSLSMELRMIDTNGVEKTVHTETELDWLDDDLVSMQGAVMDITQRKELERQLFQNQKMEAIGTLAGGIAHDFNNILNIIMGYAKVIENMLPNDSELWYKFDRIIAASKRARNLVSHILTISRQHIPKKEPVEVKKELEENIELLRAAIPSIIDIRSDFRSESCIYGDPDQLEQIVMNLCTNAYYAMKPNGGKLYVRLFDVQDRVCLEIEDTGEGIPSRVIEKIFDPYFTTKPKGEGTGLGLAIVKGIVDELEGEIQVTSQKNKGSKFRILIPSYQGTKSQKEKKTSAQDESYIEEQELRVLFIDDEHDLLELFKNYLELKGMKVDTFEDGHSALEAFSINPQKWDVLVSDISLPGIDGLEVVKRIRKQNENLPVIMYSGFMRPNLEEEIRKLGVRKLLIKPVFPENMIKEIRKCFIPEADNDV